MSKQVKVLKAIISGSFVAGDKDIESFDSVEGYLPAIDDDKAQQMIIRRYAKIWIGQSKDKDGNPKYRRVARVREVFVDSIDTEAGKQLSYVGKSIMDMNYEEIQDLAAAKDLAGIPLYKTGSLTQARRVAFSQYLIFVLGMDEKDKNKQYVHGWQAPGFNPNNYEPITPDASIRRSSVRPADIEEGIDRAALSEEIKQKTGVAGASESQLTMPQLKAIADAKGIEYNDKIGFQQLYKKIYNKAA